MSASGVAVAPTALGGNSFCRRQPGGGRNAAHRGTLLPLLPPPALCFDPCWRASISYFAVGLVEGVGLQSVSAKTLPGNARAFAASVHPSVGNDAVA